ncbi:Eco57I restriction-modification methylase domain-containing protein, partial [Modicisalibacter tunisiensis]|uniref:Eco57I restriction-modification methylase domain-containing protein n=1 Tax=Modicisalibacter tunisiensis TaxID=390637 RepID=UPI003645B11C
RCSWENTQEPWIPQVLRLLIEFRDNTNLRIALDDLYSQFKEAPVLGSLIQPEKSLSSESLFEIKWKDIEPLLSRALAEEETETTEVRVIAKGIAKAASILFNQYHFLPTNVPYLSQGKQSPILSSFCKNSFYDARHDLANVFLERMHDLLRDNGVAQVVMPQNWLYLKRYQNHRIGLLRKWKWNLTARLGEGGFDSASAAGAFVALYTFTNNESSGSNIIKFIDCSTISGAEYKARGLKNLEIKKIEQKTQFSNPGAAVTFENQGDIPLLSKYCSALSGISTGELNRFTKKHWEVFRFGGEWELSQTSSIQTCHFTGLTNAVLWQKGAGELYDLVQSVKHLNHAAQNWQRGKPNWGKPGISISKMRELKASIYSERIYDENCCAIIPADPSIMPALWEFCRSPEYNHEVRKINQSILVQTKYMIMNRPGFRRHLQTLY